MTRSRRSMLGGVAGAGVALLAGCAGGGERTGSDGEPTESETAGAETATATPTPTTNNPTATIRYDGGPVTLDEGGEASVELRYDTSGGTVASTDFSTIGQPSGSGAGILEYDDYAEVQFDTRGEFVIQLTVTFEDGRRARDTVDISVE